MPLVYRKAGIVYKFAVASTFNKVLLTEFWCARVKFLWQKTVISETLNGVSHRDDGHHHQPAPQDVQEAAHFFKKNYVKLLSGSET